MKWRIAVGVGLVILVLIIVVPIGNYSLTFLLDYCD